MYADAVLTAILQVTSNTDVLAGTIWNSMMSIWVGECVVRVLWVSVSEKWAAAAAGAAVDNSCCGKMAELASA